MSGTSLQQALAERDAARTALDGRVALLKARAAPSAIAERSKDRALALTKKTTRKVDAELRRRPAVYAIAALGVFALFARRPIAEFIGNLRKPARSAGVERPYPGDRLDRRNQGKDIA